MIKFEVINHREYQGKRGDYVSRNWILCPLKFYDLRVLLVDMNKYFRIKIYKKNVYIQEHRIERLLMYFNDRLFQWKLEPGDKWIILSIIVEDFQEYKGITNKA